MIAIDPRKLEIHPDHASVPEMPAEEYVPFLHSIREHGVRTPLERIPGTNVIIDGRTRHKAAVEAGLPLVPVQDAALAEGESPKLYMLRSAALRRHLTPSQRAVIAAEMEGLKHGGRRGKGQDAPGHLDPTVTREEAAAATGVSVRSTARARQVLDKGTPEEVEAVRKGKTTVKAAAREIDRREQLILPPPAAVDANDNEVPDRLAAVFSGRWLEEIIEELDSLIVDGVQDVATRIEANTVHVRLEKDKIAKHLASAVGSLHEAHTLAKASRPHSACGCDGGCKACRQTGYLTFGDVEA